MIDSHAHVAFDQFDEDRDEVIERSEAAGVHGWLEVGTDVAQSRRAVLLAGVHKDVRATVGVHPSDVAGLVESDWRELEVLLDDDVAVAVGEVGLDYYRGGILAEQLPVLEQFVQLAVRRGLPVVFHVRNGAKRNAHDDLLTYLGRLSEAERPPGVMHTFSGTVAQAKEYLSLGMYLSFSGVVTFKNAGELTAVAKLVPENRFLIETDCPFLAPMPHRGQRNEIAYVALVAKRLAELRGVSLDEIARVTEENTRRFFGM